MKILVADDSETSLELITLALTKLGHEVIAVTSGQAAIEQFQSNRPDLIILDVVMEYMDGFECAKKIRQIDNEDWIPIIFLSASVNDVSIAKGIDAGGDDYLTKPFSEITLAAKIKAMQRISDMRQKLFETTRKLFLLSSTDSLTGVYNRLQFDRSIKEILMASDRLHHKVALLFIDLDNFKNVNDSFGHHIGDVLLTEVAKRLKGCLKSSDFIARIGGDEFAVILSEIKDEEDAGYVAQNIINVLSMDYSIEGHHVRIGTSIGIAAYPEKGVNDEKLMLNSDVAMYHAKMSGKNNYQYFTEALDKKYTQQISFEHALKFALERNELFLTYQPIYNLESRQLIGLEVLVCWDHAQFGLVSPGLFIPLAEKTGLITAMGTWILQTAFEQCKDWPLHKYKNFKLAINISSYQIVHDNFYKLLLELLNQYQIPPGLIELELTETAIMGYSNGPFKNTIQQLHEAGVSIAIDDFGTGYSSLIRLKHLPINTLKIEKSFVQDAVFNPNSAIIVNCLIALGKNLNMNVTAEGIETGEQLEFLIANQCPQGQGFYLGKPMDFKQMLKFFDEDLKKQTKRVT